MGSPLTLCRWEYDYPASNHALASQSSVHRDELGGAGTTGLATRNWLDDCHAIPMPQMPTAYYAMPAGTQGSRTKQKVTKAAKIIPTPSRPSVHSSPALMNLRSLTALLVQSVCNADTRSDMIQTGLAAQIDSEQSDAQQPGNVPFLNGRPFPRGGANLLARTVVRHLLSFHGPTIGT